MCTIKSNATCKSKNGDGACLTVDSRFDNDLRVSCAQLCSANIAISLVVDGFPLTTSCSAQDVSPRLLGRHCQARHYASIRIASLSVPIRYLQAQPSQTAAWSLHSLRAAFDLPPLLDDTRPSIVSFSLAEGFRRVPREKPTCNQSRSRSQHPLVDPGRIGPVCAGAKGHRVAQVWPMREGRIRRVDDDLFKGCRARSSRIARPAFSLLLPCPPTSSPRWPEPPCGEPRIRAPSSCPFFPAQISRWPARLPF